METWNRTEVEGLVALAQSHEPRLFPALFFLYSTGTRRGEVLGLKWRDVDFDRRRISIRRQITGRRETTPKSGKSRVIAMTEGLAAVLFDLLAVRRRQVLARGWREIPEWVFCSDVGTALEERNFAREWYRFRRRAEMEGFRPLTLHTTRHTWATLALQAGKSVGWVADQLGHADPALTLRAYAHAMREAESDLSFAEFGGSERLHTAPPSTSEAAQTRNPLNSLGEAAQTRNVLNSLGAAAQTRNVLNSLVGRGGLEPPTLGLKARCSAN